MDNTVSTLTQNSKDEEAYLTKKKKISERWGLTSFDANPDGILI